MGWSNYIPSSPAVPLGRQRSCYEKPEEPESPQAVIETVVEAVEPQPATQAEVPFTPLQELRRDMPGWLYERGLDAEDFNSSDVERALSSLEEKGLLETFLNWTREKNLTGVSDPSEVCYLTEWFSYSVR